MFADNKILKDHRITEQALVKAIHSDDFKRIFSLNHPKALGIICKCQLLLSEQTEQYQEIDVKKNASHQKKRYGKRNMLNTLRKLEDDQESKES